MTKASALWLLTQTIDEQEGVISVQEQVIKELRVRIQGLEQEIVALTRETTNEQPL